MPLEYMDTPQPSGSGLTYADPLPDDSFHGISDADTFLLLSQAKERCSGTTRKRIEALGLKCRRHSGGGGCFLIGLIFFLREDDMPFFTLSILLFLFSCRKGILSFLQVKKKAYTMLEGICTDVRMNLLGGTQDICLADAEGNEHCLVIGKDHKIRTGLSYRFYFRDSDGISPRQEPAAEKGSADGQPAGCRGNMKDTFSHA